MAAAGAGSGLAGWVLPRGSPVAIGACALPAGMRAAAAFALGSTGLRVLHDAMARMAKQLMKGTLGTPLQQFAGTTCCRTAFFGNG